MTTKARPRQYHVTVDAIVKAVLLHSVDYCLPGPHVTVDVTNHETWTEFEVAAVKGDPAESCFLTGYDPGASCVPMDVHTEVPATVVPGVGTMEAYAYKAKQGIVGRKVGVTLDGRSGLKAILDESTGLWVNKWGGPYALDQAENDKSYLVAAPDLVTPTNVQQWIDILGQCRITWLDWMHCLRYGDYAPWISQNENTVQENYDDVSTSLAALTAAGISSILHVYSHMMIEDSVISGDAVQDHTDVKISDTLPILFGDLDAYVPNPTPTGVAAADAVAEDVGDKIVTLLNLGFKGIYFDALSLAGDIQTAADRFWWAQKFVNYIGTHRDLINRDLRTGSAWRTASNWNWLSHRTTLDQGGLTLREFADRLEYQIKVRSDWGIVTDFGWLKANVNDSDADVKYALDKAKSLDSPFSWRGLCPSKWDNPRMRRIAKLIGKQTSI